MKYDPVKQRLGKIFNRSPFLRIVFYRLLDLLLLRSWHVRKEIRSLVNEGFRPEVIADAGSGFGQYVYYLSGKFPAARITGLDIKQEQVEDCNRFFASLGKQDRISFEYSDLTRLDRKEAYDLVLCVDVMEHIEEDRLVFRHLFDALKPGGVLLISTPSDQGGSDVHHEDDASFIDEHVRDGYGMDDIDEKLREAGFNTILTRYSYGRPGKLSWKLSMKIPILMVNFSRVLFLLLPLYYFLIYPVCFVLNKADVRREHPAGTGLIVKSVK